MATTSTFFTLSRTFFTKQTLTLISPSTSSSLSRLRTLSAALHRIPTPSSTFSGDIRPFSTRQSKSTGDTSNWLNRRPKETILFDGCDFEHWLVVTNPPPADATRDDIIDSYIKTLAKIIGSEDEARRKIYSVSTRCYYAFGALVSEELSYKLKELPNVRSILPDSYSDVKNKDYGGEPFVDGKAVPYDPKYHEEWIRNNRKNKPNNASDRGDQPSGPPNMGGMPNQFGGSPNPEHGQNMEPTNPGSCQNKPHPENLGYGQNEPRPDNPDYGQNESRPNDPIYAQNEPRPSDPGYGQNESHPDDPGYGQNEPRPDNPGCGQNGPHPENLGCGQNEPRPDDPGYGQNEPHTDDPVYAQNEPRPDDPGYGHNVPHPNKPGDRLNMQPIINHNLL